MKETIPHVVYESSNSRIVRTAAGYVVERSVTDVRGETGWHSYEELFHDSEEPELLFDTHPFRVYLRDIYENWRRSLRGSPGQLVVYNTPTSRCTVHNGNLVFEELVTNAMGENVWSREDVSIGRFTKTIADWVDNGLLQL